MAGRCLIISEAGVNHYGKIDVALKLADLAKGAGSDIVKYQTYKTEKVVQGTDSSFADLKAVELKHTEWLQLAKHCENIDIEFLTTPGDVDSLKFAVEELGVKRIKIGSDDMTFKPLLKAAKKTKLPVIVSTGMATLNEVSKVVWYLQDAVSLMHCVSLYPALPDQVNLKSMALMRNMFSCKVGYSDHTAKANVILAAAAAGADMLEMHFMQDGESEYPIDAAVSFTAKQLTKLIDDVREVELMMGVYDKKPTPLERAQTSYLRKGTNGLRGSP